VAIAIGAGVFGLLIVAGAALLLFQSQKGSARRETPPE
jgi:hypothetical protein